MTTPQRALRPPHLVQHTAYSRIRREEMLMTRVQRGAMVTVPLTWQHVDVYRERQARGRRNGTMDDRLDELKANIKTHVGRLIGSGRLKRDGQADLALARARRKTRGVLLQVGGTFKEGLGQMTHDARLAAQGKADRMHGKAEQRG